MDHSPPRPRPRGSDIDHAIAAAKADYSTNSDYHHECHPAPLLFSAADGKEPWDLDDATWFKKNSRRFYRVRAAFPGETSAGPHVVVEYRSKKYRREVGKYGSWKAGGVWEDGPDEMTDREDVVIATVSRKTADGIVGVVVGYEYWFENAFNRIAGDFSAYFAAFADDDKTAARALYILLNNGGTPPDVAMLAKHGRGCMEGPTGMTARILEFKQRTDKQLVEDPRSGELVTRPKTIPIPSGVSIDDFVADMEKHNYIYLKTRNAWPASSINARLPKQIHQGKAMAASLWLDKNRPVEQITWGPGYPELIKDKLIIKGGVVSQPGVTCLNLYYPPDIKLGDPAKAQRWVDLVKKIYPEDAEHIIAYFAQRVQHPEIKINHGLVLGGDQGIGKDTICEPLKYAVGAANFGEVSPHKLLGEFTPYVKSVVLRISEARDLGEFNRFALYECTKTLLAAPPDTLECNEKHRHEYYVMNIVGVIYTTNYLKNGIHLPPNDRRHYVAWSLLKKEVFPEGFWKDMYAWYADGGFEHIAAYLHAYDISGFDPKAPPPLTKAFWDVVDANRAPEESELADAIDKIARQIFAKENPGKELPAELAQPAAVTLQQISRAASGGFYDWLNDRRNRRSIPYKLESCGYTPVRKGDPKKGHDLWRINGERQAIYAKVTLSPAEQLAAASALVKKLEAETATPEEPLDEQLAAAEERVQNLRDRKARERKPAKKTKKAGKPTKKRELVYD